jgi:hypothetical protein
MKIVKIEYWDITSFDMTLDDLKPPVLTHEFGYLVDEDDKNVWLIKDYYIGDEVHNVCVIPKGCIKKITQLREFSYDKKHKPKNRRKTK